VEPIVIEFVPNNFGRVSFFAGVTTGDFKSFKDVSFKLDSGSDFTTLSINDLLDLGYTREFLADCPRHNNDAATADESSLQLQYIHNLSIKFVDRELQGCRIFFALDTRLKSLFGSDILKYFNRDVNYDTGTLGCRSELINLSCPKGKLCCKFTLWKRRYDFDLDKTHNPRIC
jgi:hypothetical protein